MPFAAAIDPLWLYGVVLSLNLNLKDVGIDRLAHGLPVDFESATSLFKVSEP